MGEEEEGEEGGRRDEDGRCFYTRSTERGRGAAALRRTPRLAAGREGLAELLRKATVSGPGPAVGRRAALLHGAARQDSQPAQCGDNSG